MRIVENGGGRRRAAQDPLMPRKPDLSNDAPLPAEPPIPAEAAHSLTLASLRRFVADAGRAMKGELPLIPGPRGPGAPQAKRELIQRELDVISRAIDAFARKPVS